MIPERVAAAAYHTATCRSADLEAVPVDGSTMLRLRCTSCGGETSLSAGWSRLVREATRMRQTTRRSADPRLTSWWCREHDQRVSWHGRDCPDCRDEQAARQAAARTRQRQRAATRQAETNRR